jgi:hypothetical protein
MTRTKAVISALCLLAGIGPNLTATQNKHDQRWTDRLQRTPVASLETGLPEKPFGQWFADQVKPATPKYEVNDCGERNGSAEEKGKQFPLCVTASADVPTVRRVELSFIVGSYVVPLHGSEATEEKPAKVEFMYGTLGPSDPRSKQPTRQVRKLSEVPALLHP